MLKIRSQWLWVIAVAVLLVSCAAEHDLQRQYRQFLGNGSGVMGYIPGSPIGAVPTQARRDSLGYYWQEKLQKDLSWQCMVNTDNGKCRTVLVQLHLKDAWNAQQWYDALQLELSDRWGKPVNADFGLARWQYKGAEYVLQLYSGSATVTLNGLLLP